MRNRCWFGFTLFTASSLLLTGCFGGHSASRGIPLSEAMAASASGSSANLASSNSHREATHSHGSEMSVTLAAETDGPSDVVSDYFDGWLISGAAEEVIPISNDIRNISRFELTPLAVQDEENYAGAYVGWGDVRFRSGSFPDRAVTDTWLLDVGLVGRHYFTPPKTFISPYITGGVFGQIMFWDYRTPLVLGGEIIQSDSIYGGGGFVGFGLAAARKEHLGIFIEARLGFSLYDNATTQGFYNNVLDDYGFVSVRAGVSIGF